jgi:hypothetical protein
MADTETRRWLLTGDEAAALRAAETAAEVDAALAPVRARWVADALEAEAEDFERRAANVAVRTKVGQRDAERWRIAVEVLREHAAAVRAGRDPSWAFGRPAAEYRAGTR